MSARISTRGVSFLAVILLVGLGSAPAAKAAYYIGDRDIPIPDPCNRDDPAIANAVINVTEHYVISDLDVRINITHTNILDLQLYLERPGGKRICLNSFPFGQFFDYDNYIDTIFDDEALISIEQGQPPFTGRFKPLSPYKLSEFYGEDAFGEWRLQVYDLYPTNTGTLDSFELFTNIPEPTTALLFALAGAFTLARSSPKRAK